MLENGASRRSLATVSRHLAGVVGYAATFTSYKQQFGP